jgi:hypothetical protein
MADLLDIAPATSVEPVWIDGNRISVRGIQFGNIASIVKRFPDVAALARGGGDVVARLFVACGTAVGPIIAAGCGHPDEEAYERRATELLPEQQIALLAVIFRLTFPNGIGSFVEMMARLIGGKHEGAKPMKFRSSTSKNSRSSSLPSDGAQVFHPTMQ